jgi:hypothetical protein
VRGTPAIDAVFAREDRGTIALSVNGAAGTVSRDGFERLHMDLVPLTDQTRLTDLTIGVHTPNAEADGSRRYINALYVKFLGRFAAEKDHLYWLPFLATHNADAVARGVATSPEAFLFTVRTWFVKFLGRPVLDPGEWFWVNKLLAGETEEQVLGGILASDELFTRAQTRASGGSPQERYLRALYRALLDRDTRAFDLS